MAAVAGCAVNLSVMRSFDPHSTESLPHFLFACAILPMASLLILSALVAALALFRQRQGLLPSFLVGFQMAGWAAVFSFLTLYSVATSVVLKSTGAIGELIRPTIGPLLDAAPTWALAFIEIGFATVVFTLPQLVLALLGGWFARRSGLTACFEWGGVDSASQQPIDANTPDQTVQRTRHAAALYRLRSLILCRPCR
jgi:hypothetical protein